MIKSNKPKALFCWSGGKDSALCLYRILQSKEFEIVALLTTLNGNFRRISMHGVRESLLESQARLIGLPLEKMYVCQKSNEEYEIKMKALLLKYRSQGVNHVIFGDIFLEDLREWRDANLRKVDMKGVYPLWKIDTAKLVEEFIALGFSSVTCCVNDGYLNEKHVGRLIDRKFVKSLPKNVDPCGERGEFHSFAYKGPIFRKKLNIEIGEKVYRKMEPMPADSFPLSQDPLRPVTKGFWFCDLYESRKRPLSQP